MSTWVAFSGGATLQPEGSAGTGVASTTFVTSTWTVSLTTFSYDDLLGGRPFPDDLR